MIEPIKKLKRKFIEYIKFLLNKIILKCRSNSFFDSNKRSSLIKNITNDKQWDEFQKVPQEKLTKSENPLIHTDRVSFELSNLCNYAPLHLKCPMNLETRDKHIILPGRIVFNVLDILAKYGFNSKIAFHNYNEPLIDPRLFKFIEYARNVCPNSDIYICTNGYYLNQNLADELVDSGVSNIFVSVYSKSELDRLSRIKVNIPYKLVAMKLDDRLGGYHRPKANCRKSCFAPLNEIIIGRDADVLLCCLDWRRLYTFGDLRNQTFEEILRSGKMQAVYKKLSKGERFLNLCQRCNWTR